MLFSLVVFEEWLRAHESPVAMLSVSPGFFSPSNLRDLLMSNLPALIVALGMTLIILTAEIDISVGSIFAICSVAAGVLSAGHARTLLGDPARSSVEEDEALILMCYQSADFREGMEAFLAKRTPQFQGA